MTTTDSLTKRDSLTGGNYKRTALFLLALLISSAYIYTNFPGADGYYTKADEGIYYRQAKEVLEHGLSGFKINAENYITKKELQIFPVPSRIIPVLSDALALGIHDSYFTLSLLSLLYFIILCLTTYYYIARLWDHDIALIASILLCFSPLGCGMARRALIDSLSYLAAALPLFSFLYYAVHQTKKNFIIFCSTLTLAWLTRETGVLFYPFYLGALLCLKGPEGQKTSHLKAWAGIAGAATAALLVFVLIFGPETLYKIAMVIYQSIFVTKDIYVRQYLSGPWYNYFVDFMILSPFTMLMAFFYSGFYLFNKEYELRMNILIVFFAYIIVVYAFLQKDVRLVMVLDLLVRIFTAFGIALTVKKFNTLHNRKALVTAAIVLAIVTADISSFWKHFVINKTFDPVSYNLLYAERFIPVAEAADTLTGDAAGDERSKNESDKLSFRHYLSLGLNYYQSGKYAESIEMSNKALLLKPDSDLALNNICAAHNALMQWDKAIEACEKAVQINPDNQLAKNNLVLAKRQKSAPKAGK